MALSDDGGEYGEEEEYVANQDPSTSEDDDGAPRKKAKHYGKYHYLKQLKHSPDEPTPTRKRLRTRGRAAERSKQREDWADEEGELDGEGDFDEWNDGDGEYKAEDDSLDDQDAEADNDSDDDYRVGKRTRRQRPQTRRTVTKGKKARHVESGSEAHDGDEDEEGFGKPKRRGGGRPARRPAARASARKGRYLESESEPEDQLDDQEGLEEEDLVVTTSRRPARQAAVRATSKMKVNYADVVSDDDGNMYGLDDEEAEENGKEDVEEEYGEDDMMEEEDDDGDEDDEEFARQLDKEMNGRALRPRKGKASAFTDTPSPPRRIRGSSSRDGNKVKNVQRVSQRAQHKVSYVEESSSDSGSDLEAVKKKQQHAIAAFEDPSLLDDEVERVLGHRDIEGDHSSITDPWLMRELYVKWKRYSYIHCSWDNLATLGQLLGFKRVLNYIKRVDELEVARQHLPREELELLDVERQMEEQLVEEYKQVERIVAERQDQNEMKYLVKWKGLSYAECTWENSQDLMDKAEGFEAQLDAFLERQQRMSLPSHSVPSVRRVNKDLLKCESQPEFLSFGKLRDYQLEGLNWLIYSWLSDRNCILADEMGLGKTVQCVSFLGYLSMVLDLLGPFLVVVPLSTVPNWIREFTRWAPNVNTVVYVGDSRSREVLREFEFFTGKSKGRLYKFEVVITTYELILKDAHVLGKVKWSYLLVDEAHRLKNAESALYQELIAWHFANKLLITGTPLQNSIKELWALLHFLESAQFPDCESFEEQYTVNTADGIARLHEALRPHMLRRVIKDVEKSLPPKNERILRVEMTPLQKQYYKWILTRNFKELNKGAKGGGQVSLLNIIGELKKCCNHPFLFESAEENYRGSETDKTAVERITVTSGKMVLLDKLMKRLKETGHRVLIFSQMVRVLDIISDYMRLRGFQHQRLDGSTPSAQRHQAMEHFNKPDSPDFAFLLSTRAGGLGINLATADTVIIFDSDWNPQNDLQAMSRAHRIGQTETVNIYRFVTSGSVEEDILERAKKKMVLDHLVIQRMDTSGRTVLDPSAQKNNAKQMFNKDELAAILRFGAEDLFKGNEQEVAEKEKRMYEEDIDAILERAEVVDSRMSEEAGGASDLLNAFNVATFRNAEDDEAFWSKLIPVEEQIKGDDTDKDLGVRTARLKAEGLVGTDDEDIGEGGRKLGAARRAPRVPRKVSTGAEPGPPVDGAALRVDEWCLDVDEHGQPLNKQEDDPDATAHVRTLSRRDANAFVRSVRRYGLDSRLDDIATEVGPALEDATPEARLSLWHSLMDGCKKAVHALVEGGEDAKDAILDFFGVSVKAQELTSQVHQLQELKRRVAMLKDPVTQFRLDSSLQPSPPKWAKAIRWTPRDDAMLLLGVSWHGLGHWDKIAADSRLKLGDKLHSAVATGRDEASKDLPKASHFETRVLGLLKKMYQASKARGQTKEKERLRMSVLGPPRKVAAARDSQNKPQLKLVVKRRPSDYEEHRDLDAPSEKRPKLEVAVDRKASGSRAEAVDRGGPSTARPQLGREECFQLLEAVGSDVKKLRKLQQQRDLDTNMVLEKTKKYLFTIGQHIEKVVKDRGNSARLPLWDFVSKQTQNAMSGDKMERLYIKIKAKHQAAGTKLDKPQLEKAPKRKTPPRRITPPPPKATVRQTSPGDSVQESGEIIEPSDTGAAHESSPTPQVEAAPPQPVKKILRDYDFEYGDLSDGRSSPPPRPNSMHYGSVARLKGDERGGGLPRTLVGDRTHTSYLGYNKLKERQGPLSSNREGGKTEEKGEGKPNGS